MVRSRGGGESDEAVRPDADDHTGNREGSSQRQGIRQPVDRRTGQALSGDRLHGRGERGQGWGGDEAEGRAHPLQIRAVMSSSEQGTQESVLHRNLELQSGNNALGAVSKLGSNFSPRPRSPNPRVA